MSNLKPIPDGVPPVMPMLVCLDAAAEIEFCRAAFEAVEPGRRPGPDGSVARIEETTAAEREQRWDQIVKQG